MSTALYLWSSSSNGDEDQEKKLPLEAHEQLNVEPAKPARSKRAAKSQSSMPKKQRQRGLGVAQLEQLRTQESKFTETDRSVPPSLVPAALDLSQNHHFPFAFPVVDPETGMSMARFAPVSYYDAFAEAQIRSQQLALQRYRIANGGGMPLADSRGIFPDPTQLDRCRVTAPEMRFQGRSGFPYGGATSVEAMMEARELTSSQKTQCLSNQCEVCAKKRFQGENLGFQDFGNGSSGGGFMDVATNGGDFLGLNIGSGSRGFGGRGEWRGGSSGMHVDQEMEDVNIAVQRKGKSVGGCYYKEYEFFPRKDCGSSRGGSGSVAVGAAEASVAEAAASNFLDLSLKLSF